jgi:CBS domain-containing protein
MELVKHILDKKGYTVFSISPDEPVYEALRIMSEKDIGALLVIEDNALAGIVTERDYSRKVILRNRASKETPIREIMSTKILVVDINRHIDECMALMTGKHIRHLPVFDGDKLAGIISIGDVVNAVIGEKEFVIDQLVRYISG